MQQPDWSKAPEGATHYQPHQGAYYKHSPLHRCWLVWASDHPMGELRWHQARGTDEKQLIARPAAWDGTGLPPVGTVCIVKPHNTLWGFSSTAGHERTVLAYHGEFVWLGQGNMALETTRTDKVDFLPLRTPEQIAAEERRAAIREMERFFRDGELLHVSLGRLYDAGCRLPGGAQ